MYIYIYMYIYIRIYMYMHAPNLRRRTSLKTFLYTLQSLGPLGSIAQRRHIGLLRGLLAESGLLLVAESRGQKERRDCRGTRQPPGESQPSQAKTSALPRVAALTHRARESNIKQQLRPDFIISAFSLGQL